MPWRLADSLKTLRDQINAAAPARSKESDGSIGDTNHASRNSDHNPWVKDRAGTGVVTAIDITHDPTHHVDGQSLADQLIKDRRVKYVIFNRRIWKNRRGGKRWESYTGTNAHKQHVHVSVQPDPELYDSKEPWILSPPPAVAQAVQILKRGDRGEAVERLQTLLQLTSDGKFGPLTETAVKELQNRHNLPQTGIADKVVWCLLEAQSTATK